MPSTGAWSRRCFRVAAARTAYTRRDPRRAFTLVELLVVIAIIAILMSILLPSLSRAREQAKQTVCLANQKTLALAFVQYANEHRDAIVGSFTDRFSWTDWPQFANGRYLTEAELAAQLTSDAEIRGMRKGLLFPYTFDPAVGHCPSDRRNARRPEHGAIAYRTYSMPNCLGGDQGWETMVGGRRVARRTTQLRRPGESFAFIEEADPRGVNMNSWVMWLNREQWIDPLTVWHYNKSTIGFADGHAIVHLWLDSRTIRMSREQVFNTDARDNADYQYLKARWAIQD